MRRGGPCCDIGPLRACGCLGLWQGVGVLEQQDGHPGGSLSPWLCLGDSLLRLHPSQQGMRRLGMATLHSVIIVIIIIIVDIIIVVVVIAVTFIIIITVVIILGAVLARGKPSCAQRSHETQPCYLGGCVLCTWRAPSPRSPWGRGTSPAGAEHSHSLCTKANMDLSEGKHGHNHVPL